jgi:hypothetical protein
MNKEVPARKDFRTFFIDEKSPRRDWEFRFKPELLREFGEFLLID